MSTHLSAYFRSRAERRERKAEEYPDDERNARSAEALYSLASYVDGGEAEARDSGIVKRLEAHLGHALGREGAKRAVFRYGFGNSRTAWNHHEVFLKELWVMCMEDAYEFAREHGDDPTEELLPFEVEAAKGGVYLPRDYWERRPNQTEHELEETVEVYRGGED